MHRQFRDIESREIDVWMEWFVLNTGLILVTLYLAILRGFVEVHSPTAAQSGSILQNILGGHIKAGCIRGCVTVLTSWK